MKWAAIAFATLLLASRAARACMPWCLEPTVITHAVAENAGAIAFRATCSTPLESYDPAPMMKPLLDDPSMAPIRPDISWLKRLM